MIIKQVEREDLSVIMQLNELQDFKLDGIGNSIVDRIVYEGNEPIAYGTVKRTAEAILLVNPNTPLLTRARAMRELMIIAQAGTYEAGIKQLHCFVKNRQLCESLIKQFGFIETKDFVLVKNV